MIFIFPFYTTFLNVKFYHKGEHKCTACPGHKFPEKMLASKRCTVYILGNTLFVAGSCIIRYL